jgi:hypothetical protein
VEKVNEGSDGCFLLTSTESITSTSTITSTIGKLVFADRRFIPVEAIDPAGEHRYDTREHFFAPRIVLVRVYRALTVAGLKRVAVREQT